VGKIIGVISCGFLLVIGRLGVLGIFLQNCIGLGCPGSKRIRHRRNLEFNYDEKPVRPH
jgi:hypothetical protein